MTIALKRPRPHTAKSVRPAPPPPEKKTIPIVRRCLAGGEDPAVTFGVFCPAQEATVPAERCAECGFLTRFPDHATSPGAAIECTPPNMHDKTAARTSPRIDMAEAAARVPLGEVLRHRIVCVMPETSVETMMSRCRVNSRKSMISSARLVKSRVSEPSRPTPNACSIRVVRLCRMSPERTLSRVLRRLNKALC